MYVLSNGHTYIGVSADNVPTSVSNINKALQFTEEKKALNYKENLKSTLRKFNWEILKLEENEEDCDICENSDEYIETELEKSGFDISKFFCETVQTVSQLRDYAKNMHILEQEYNKKILDVRHYKRDINTKLNAIQLQRLEQFEIQLERERYECKSNRTIAEIFLSDFKRLENIKYVEVIKHVKESEYKPEIFTYEMLDEIVGKRRDKNE